MVTEYGMSDRLGLVTYESPRYPTFLQESFTPPKTHSETKATQIDEEIASVMEQTHNMKNQKVHDTAEKLFL